jgi:hypothetical protein
MRSASRFRSQLLEKEVRKEQKEKKTQTNAKKRRFAAVCAFLENSSARFMYSDWSKGRLLVEARREFDVEPLAFLSLRKQTNDEAVERNSGCMALSTQTLSEKDGKSRYCFDFPGKGLLR